MRKGYKQTEVGVIPEEWEVVTGLELTSLISKGASPRWQGFDYTDRGMLFVTSENVRDGYLDVSEPKYLPLEFHQKLERTQLRCDDILINLVGASIGRSCRITEDLGPANINQAVAVFRLRNVASAPYIAFFFQSPPVIKRIFDMQVDAARPNISLGNLREFKIVLPPSHEQDAIAAALGDMDALIAGLDELIAKKRDIKQAAMQQLLTGQTRLPGFWGEWEEKPLGSAITFQRGYDLPHRLRTQGTYPIVTSSGINETHGEPRVCGPGVVTGRYGTIGEVFYIEEDFWPLNTTLFVKDFWGNNPKFVAHWLRTVDFASHSGKSGVPGVNRNDLHKIPAYIPSPEEQSAIAAVLSDMDAEIAALEQRLEKTRAVKQGMMQELLTGRTRLV